MTTLAALIRRDVDETLHYSHFALSVAVLSTRCRLTAHIWAECCSLQDPHMLMESC